MQFCNFDLVRSRRSAYNETQIVQNSRIVSGTAIDGTTAEMAWMVRLEFTDSNGDIQRCAGTVVHKNWILTSQDCCQVKKLKIKCFKWVNPKLSLVIPSLYSIKTMSSVVLMSMNSIKLVQVLTEKPMEHAL